MQDQILSLQKFNFVSPRGDNSISLINPENEFNQNYVVYRVKLKNLEITQKTRDGILEALNNDKKFIQIADITVMLNAISSIEPLPLESKQEAEEKKERLDRVLEIKKSFI